MDYASCLEVHRLWKGDLLMIKGFLLALAWNFQMEQKYATTDG